jgi:hypothetical protein
MPDELRQRFFKTADITFDIETVYRLALLNQERPKTVIEKSIYHHAQMCIDNSESLTEAKLLAKELADDIESRVRHFTKCLANSTKNYRDWLIEDYKVRLMIEIGKLYRQKIFSME